MTKTASRKNEPVTILTVREVAQYLRMSETKVYGLAKRHSLPAVRIGKVWRFRKDLLDEWLSGSIESSLKPEHGKR